jgi:hypothetical protein
MVCKACLVKGMATHPAIQEVKQVCPYRDRCETYRDAAESGSDNEALDEICFECRNNEMPLFLAMLDDTIGELQSVRKQMGIIVEGGFIESEAQAHDIRTAESGDDPREVADQVCSESSEGCESEDQGSPSVSNPELGTDETPGR